MVLVSIVLFLFVGSAGMVIAQNNENNNSNAGRGSEINMTYGQCVVEAVGIKNICYDTVKGIRGECITTVGNDTAQTKKCKNDYKTDMKKCKADFKTSKKECIMKTKPGIWARIRYSFS